ncbi:MAG: 3-dehydroquinate synthase [Ignavibacteriales bacterium]|nr:3-dehydroquinate synthase [Ignavibacteriales bacterium]
MKKTIVAAKSSSYPYYSGYGILEKAVKILKKEYQKSSVFMVIDEHVFRYHRVQILAAFEGVGTRAEHFVLSSGEQSKSFAVLQKLLAAMLEKKCDRNTLLIAIGGGVTGDLAGFAASVYKRGVRLLHVPTTLLSMIDSSVGGKTGINFTGYKNIIGTFFQPDAVIADTSFLATLPEREFDSGLGEAAKYAFLGDAANYNMLSSYLINHFSGILRSEKQTVPIKDNKLLRLIGNCINIKAVVVAQDEHEGGLRKILNLGHTFAHAIESVGKYKVFHGEAVAAGMEMVVSLSTEMGILNADEAKKYIRLLRIIPRPDTIKNMPADKLIAAMLQDKKNKEGEIRFVLVKTIGELVVDVPAPVTLVEWAIAAYKHL